MSAMHTTSAARDAMAVARREFVERGRSKAFLISTGLILLALIGVMVYVALTDQEDPERRIGFIGGGQPVVEAAAEVATQLGVDVRIVAVEDRAAAERRLDPEAEPEDQVLDAVVDDAQRVLVHEGLDEELEALLVGAVQTVALEEVLAGVRLSEEQQQRLLTAPELQVEATDPGDEVEEGPALGIAALAVFALYGLLLFYGNYVAQGIVEEKASRVIEVLLSTVRPTSVLYGKIVGLAALGIIQSLVIGGVGLAAATVLLEVTIPSEAYATLALALAWYVLGFVLYASVFAVSASLVSRQEDLGATTAPPIIVIIGAFFAAQNSLQDPDSTFSLVASLVPFSAPLVQPLRYGAQVIDWWEVPVAIGLCLVTIAILVPAAARFYSGSALRFGGRVKLREAWRGAER
jgi:ABC-2 type transport system permease protein